MPYQRYTRAELRQQLQDRWEDVPFFDEDDANLAINHTLRLWNAITGYWRQRIVIAPSPIDDPLLPIPGTLVQRTQIQCNGRTFGPPVSLEELSKLRPNWFLERTTDGGDVPTRPTIWAPVGLTLVAIWPAPMVNVSYEVDGIRVTPVLTTDAEFVDIGDEEFSTLLGYALHVAAFKAGATFVTRTAKYRLAFLGAAALRNARMKSQQWYRQYQRQVWQNAIRPEAIPDPSQPAVTA